MWNRDRDVYYDICSYLCTCMHRLLHTHTLTSTWGMAKQGCTLTAMPSLQHKPQVGAALSLAASFQQLQVRIRASFASAPQSNMNSSNLQIRGKWQCFLWMVLVPTHSAHTAIRSHPFPAPRMGAWKEHQPFLSLEVASVLNATEEKSAPPGVLCTLSLTSSAMTFLTWIFHSADTGPTGMMPMLPLRRKAKK